MQPVTVLSQTAIANHAVAKDLVDVPEWGFHFGPSAGLELTGVQFPARAGVYKATIQVPDPKNPGQWITKTSNNSTNTMFPKDWEENRIKKEVDAAWNDPNKIVQGDKWISVTPSGVKVEGWISPRTTVYPVYQTPK